MNEWVKEWKIFEKKEEKKKKGQMNEWVKEGTIFEKKNKKLKGSNERMSKGRKKILKNEKRRKRVKWTNE